MNHKVDILIIGAGPAGAAAAITIKKYAPHLSCLIIEKTDFREDRIGESLSPQANRFLEQLEFKPYFLEQDHLTSYSSTACWGQAEPLHNEFIAQLYGYGWRLKRNKFDYDLAKAAEQKGSILCTKTTYLKHQRQNDHWLVDILEKGKEKSIMAKFVIDASGRSTVFAKKEGAKKQMYDRLIGIYAWFSPNKTQDNNASPLVEAQENGWWYSAMLPDKRWISVWMTDSDISKDLDWYDKDVYLKELAKATYTQKRLGSLTYPNQIQIYPASTYFLDKLGGNAWIATGDTVYTYDPLSSSGIVKALRTGIFSAYVCIDYFKGEQKESLEKYERFLKADFEQYLETKKKYYSDEKRWQTAEFWLRRSL